MDYILSTGQTYKINGRVDGLTLDECGIVADFSGIIPYFDCNILGDPDVKGLTVLIKNNQGKEIGFRLKYALPEKPTPAETGATNDAEGGENGETPINDDGANESEQTGTQKKPEKQVTASPSPQGTASASPKVSQSESPTEKPAAEGTGSDTENDGAPSVPDTAKEQIDEIIINVKKLSEDLPEFSFPKGNPTGLYTLIFQVNGNNGEVLSSTEKPVFFIADKQLRIEDLRDYLPGISENVHVVPPETKIILEATVLSSGEFEPYIIWYNGKKIIGEGPVSNGFSRFMWQTPKQVGFQSIRAEIFPFDPNKQGFGVRGISRNLSLPVSLKHGRTGYFDGISKTLGNWYQLWGDVHDTFDTSLKEKDLVHNNETINWLPYLGTYGLQISTTNTYKLPDKLFTKIKFNEGSGQVLFRFIPTGNGALLYSTLQCEENSWDIILSLEGNEISLGASGENQIIPDTITLPLIYDKNGFVTAALDFQFFDDSNVIALSLENEGDFDKWYSIQLDGEVTGNGSVSFGNAGDDNAVTKNIAIVTETAFRYVDVSPVKLQKEAEEAGIDDPLALNPVNENENYL
ncbi:hypothetical protein FACS1894190_09550 [Spirochaetia bacterium]|nr:hypothetical protein FACS1894190_09550 [Spirochaetia bacterium]